MRLTCFAALLFLATSAGGQQGQDKPDTDGFQVPKFELKGNLTKIFDIKDCEYISGITCRIHYNGVLPLPSRVFFTELRDVASDTKIIGLAMFDGEFRKSQFAAAGFDMILPKQAGLAKLAEAINALLPTPPTNN